jgi:formamidopyrimidine-DNA glycosylase
MPELPDITIYLEAFERRILGQKLEAIRLDDIFILRTARPPLDSVFGQRVTQLRRVGKRVAFGFENGRWLLVHLMIAGRFQWADAGMKLVAKNLVATFRFESGTLALTEASKKRRAALYVLENESALRDHDPGGMDVLTSSPEGFAAAVTAENHTLKRTLTDPALFSGIGNAYSDEILHRAKLSPIVLSQKLSAEQLARLHTATIDVLTEWTDRLRKETGDGFPTKVTAFRPEMAVHGKFGKPCPVCGTPVQRIVYAENESNYCPKCQTGGRLLADRSLSRLLKDDWPRTLEEGEALRKRVGAE